MEQPENAAQCPVVAAAARVNRLSAAMWRAQAAHDAQATPRRRARLDRAIAAYRVASEAWAAAYASAHPAEAAA